MFNIDEYNEETASTVASLLPFDVPHADSNAVSTAALAFGFAERPVARQILTEGRRAFPEEYNSLEVFTNLTAQEAN